MDKTKSNFDPERNISDRSEPTGQSLFVYIDEWEGNRLFTYLVVLLLCVWYFWLNNATIGLVVALGVAYFIVSYMNHKSKTTNDTLQDIVNIKEDSIKPKPKETTLKQPDVRNFLFSIQDLRVHNPQAYEEAIRKTDNFFEYYDLVYTEPSRAYIYFELMTKAKRDALNTIKSIVLNVPEDRRVRAKLNHATDQMDEILTKYLDQISYIADEYTYKHGWNIKTKILNYGPKPFNEYGDMFQNYSYEIY